ncbi:MAG: DUF4037 domain-containing protein [Spirochaetes bacterium]|nr:DUF4037 domain-containing protein [Spirochaetota bacterium]
MRNKVIKIAEVLTSAIVKWTGAEAVILGEAAEIGVYDPYFSIDLDIIYSGPLLPANDRKYIYGNPQAFETSPVYPEDRFLIDELPVMVNCISLTRIEIILKRIKDNQWVYRENGTNMFYRIKNGISLYSRTARLENIRKELKSIPENFWRGVIDSSKCQLESVLSDLGAAAYRNDNHFFIISAAAFLKYLASLIFALHREFEPSGRMISGKINGFTDLPDGFYGRFESFLRYDDMLDLGKKREIAELIVKDFFSITPTSFIHSS